MQATKLAATMMPWLLKPISLMSAVLMVALVVLAMMTALQAVCGGKGESAMSDVKAT